MNVFGLDISWAATANERRYLRWELVACEQARCVFPRPGSDVLAVLFGGDRRSFDASARTLGQDDAFDTTHDPHFGGIDLYGHRSLPQIAARVTVTSASPGSGGATARAWTPDARSASS